jgi:glutaredoxin 3
MDFVIYTKPNCTYCEQAKKLIESKGMTYEERIIDVGQVKDPSKIYVTVHQLKQRVPSAQTVPQIFRGEEHIGGFESLKKILKT